MKTKNWKTTLGGVAMILSGLALLGKMLADGTPLTVETLSPVGIALSGGLGLLKAKDHDVTGAGPTAVRR